MTDDLTLPLEPEPGSSTEETPAAASTSCRAASGPVGPPEISRYRIRRRLAAWNRAMKLDASSDPELGTGRAEPLLHAGQSLAASGRFADAEPSRLGSQRQQSALPTVPVETGQQVIRALVDLYASWNTAEPTAGHAAPAADWEAKLNQAMQVKLTLP